MDPVLFLSFLTATLIIVISPGPSCALAASQAVKHGPRAAMLSVVGDGLGSIVHILIAVISLNVLINAASVILPYLQIGGGMFILYLAYQAFFASDHGSAHPVKAARNAFLGGFFACVTNPKAIVFFVALFPGFISPEHSIAVRCNRSSTARSLCCSMGCRFSDMRCSRGTSCIPPSPPA